MFVPQFDANSKYLIRLIIKHLKLKNKISILQLIFCKFCIFLIDNEKVKSYGKSKSNCVSPDFLDQQFHGNF